MRQNKKNKKILAGFEPGSSVSLAAALPTPPPGLLLQPRRKMGYINKTGLSHAQDCAKHLQIFFANASHAQICAKNTCKFFFGNPLHALTYSTSDFFKKDSRISFFCVQTRRMRKFAQKTLVNFFLETHCTRWRTVHQIFLKKIHGFLFFACKRVACANLRKKHL